MSPTLRVALHGFGEFEAATLASVLRLAGSPDRRYERVPAPAQAQIIVAAADRAGVVAELTAAGRAADTVFVGGQRPHAGAAWLPRPINPLQVQRAIDALADRRPAAAERSAPAAAALLIDDSPIALRYLQLKLQQHGLGAECARTSARALELLQRQPFAYVFIDVELGRDSALDGLALCQQIRREHRRAGPTAPVLTIVSAHDHEVDRARGTLAGADHYLAKPVSDAALAGMLAHHRPPARAPRSRRSAPG